jgi:hypothetical protein
MRHLTTMLLVAGSIHGVAYPILEMLVTLCTLLLVVIGDGICSEE